MRGALCALVVATHLGGCAGPMGFRLGLNPEVVRELRDDPAAWCIVIEVGRIVYWRDNAPGRPATTIAECIDPRSVPVAK